MLNRWNEAEAAELAADATTEADALLARRAYSSRLIGGEPELAMHGGGNTSVKVMRDLGRGPEPVLHVKGSGRDLARVQAADLPGLRLAPILDIHAQGVRFGDGEMMRFLRGHLLDPQSPDPSVETLLHAFLPARFVDHGHASAMLALSNQPEAEQRRLVAALFGESVIFLPYVFPGFDLAIAGAAAAAASPAAQAMWLAHHGLFTWGDTADQSYGRFIEVVSVCEAHLASAGAALPPMPVPAANDGLAAIAERLAAALTGLPAFGDGVQLDLRAGMPTAELASDPALLSAVARGTITPDHVIRIKPFPLVLSPDATKTEIADAIDAFGRAYCSYFDLHAPAARAPVIMLDTAPRVAIIRGLGVIGIGKSAREAGINADLAEQNLRVVRSAERLGQYQPIPRAEQFLIEYWELEQAKLRPAAAR
ncbi:class II aldolase/adducin family protein [Tropicimonas sp. IMCC34043]|uniref:class II aldolase/adducin family protein n=1 Tax=Tropicimonas sp. IMCC34043 TaxID=2248760 RepID=UPI00130063CF|nr:class II aldolase/adducin family protein [Tropicimonas sp. IMCC34043]